MPTQFGTFKQSQKVQLKVAEQRELRFGYTSASYPPTHPHAHYALPRVPGLTRGIPAVHIGHASGLYVRAETVIKAWQGTPNCSIAPPPLRSISTSMPAISERYGFIAPSVSCSERPVVYTSSTTSTRSAGRSTNPRRSSRPPFDAGSASRQREVS